MFQHFTTQYDVKRICLERQVLNINGLSIYIVYLIRSIACFFRQIATFYVRVEKMLYHRAFISLRTTNINEALEGKVGQHIHNVIRENITVRQAFFTMPHAETVDWLMGKINTLTNSLPESNVEPVPGFLCVIVHKAGIHPSVDRDLESFMYSTMKRSKMGPFPMHEQGKDRPKIAIQQKAGQEREQKRQKRHVFSRE